MQVEPLSCFRKIGNATSVYDMNTFMIQSSSCSQDFSFLYQENYMDSYTKQPKLEWAPLLKHDI